MGDGMGLAFKRGASSKQDGRRLHRKSQGLYMKGVGYVWRRALLVVVWGAGVLDGTLWASQQAGVKQIQIEAGWSSGYVTEGVERFPEEPVFMGSVDLSWQRLALVIAPVVVEGGAEYEISVGGEYRIDLATYALADMQLAGGIRSVDDSTSAESASWELYGNVVGRLRGGFVWGLDVQYAVYPTSAGYLEIGVSRPIRLPAFPGRCSVSPGVALGYDAGMVSGIRELRANHVHASICADWHITPRFGIKGALHHTFPLDRFESRFEGKEQSWTQVGVFTMF